MIRYLAAVVAVAGLATLPPADATPTAEQQARYRAYLNFDSLAPPFEPQVRWEAGGTSLVHSMPASGGAPTWARVDARTGRMSAADAPVPPDPSAVRRYLRWFPLAGPVPMPEVASPDASRFALVKDGDVHVRAAGGGEPERITTSAAPGVAWDVDATRLYAVSEPVHAQPWSPDGKWLFASRIDRSRLGSFVEVDFLGPAVTTSSLPSELAAGPLPRVELALLEVDARRVVTIDVGDTAEHTYTLLGWRPDGSEVLFVRANRDYTQVDVLAADRSGGSRVLVSERGPRWVRNAHELMYSGNAGFTMLPDGSGFVWESERDGWNHLYLYDMRGRLVRRLTRGEFPVLDVEVIDQVRGWVYFTAHAAPRPYDTHLYRVPLRGGRMQQLTAGEGLHAIEFSPTREWFVDTHSSVSRPPAAELRRADGSLVRTLARADVSKLEAAGWSVPEEFTVKAADGKTDLWGVIYKPFDFDPARRYPVVEHVYGGPQVAYVRRGFEPLPMPHRHHQMALAQLGYIVVVLDARGTPGRSKAFHDAIYGDWQVIVDDHAAALRQLIAARPYMDAARVGIYGHSWGGTIALRALATRGDLYRAAVVSGPDFECASLLCEPYLGLLPRDRAAYDRFSLYALAPQIRGALLMIAGTREAPMVPAVMKMSRRLIDAGLRHEALILPAESHGYRGAALEYVLDRTTAFFESQLNGAPWVLGPMPSASGAAR